MKNYCHRIALFVTFISLMLPMSASALGLGFGAKVGTGSGEVDGNDMALNTVMLVGNFDLVVMAIEGNIGWHRAALADDDKNFTDELSLVGLAKVGMPLIPAVLSLDFGAGLDQRIILGAEAAGAALDDVSGSRTLLPISVQLTGSVLLARLYGEMRYNYELSSKVEVGGVEVDTKPLNELMFLIGATF